MLRHVALLVFAQFGENREREGFVGGAFGFGKIAFAVAEIAEAFLQVQRERVVNFRADSRGGEVRAESVASRGADDELIVDVMIRQAGISISLGRRLDDFIEFQP